MKKIEAKIIADSINKQGDRITTYLLTFPRFILAELNTHRIFSRNSASSRAVPFDKMVKSVEEDPFIPIAWQKDHKGMQGKEYITDEYNLKTCIEDWLEARNNAVKSATDLSKGFNKKDEGGNWVTTEPEDFVDGVTKQLCNRLLEPFMWHTVLVTATEFDNFFDLRCPQYKLIGLCSGPVKSRKKWLEKMQFSSALHPSQYPKTEEEWWMLSESGAEIHMQALAEAMWDAYNESIPKLLKEGEWHIPFGNDITMSILDQQDIAIKFPNIHSIEDLKIKIATARCARLSYNTFDGEIDYEKDIKLHDRLLADGHASAFEHCCRVLSEEEYNNCGKLIPLEDGTIEFQKGWVDNFRGFKSYRRILNF